MVTHGGKRAGSGRKKKEPTKTIRVPISLEKEVLLLISDHKQGKKTKANVLSSENQGILDEICISLNCDTSHAITTALASYLNQVKKNQVLFNPEDMGNNDFKIFAEKVQSGVNKIKVEHEKVFILDAWKLELCNIFQMTFKEFKEILLVAHRKRLLTLAREDMPTKADLKDKQKTIQQSEITYLEAAWHYIRQSPKVDDLPPQKTPKKKQKPIAKKSGISKENKAIIFTLYDQVEIGNLSIERVVDELRINDITTVRGYEWTAKNLRIWITNNYKEYRTFIAEKEKKEQQK